MASIPGLHKGLKIPALAGRYDNPNPTRCLAPIDFLKIAALYTCTAYVFSNDQGSVLYIEIDTNTYNNILQIAEKATGQKVRFLLTLPWTPPLHPRLASIGKASILVPQKKKD